MCYTPSRTLCFFALGGVFCYTLLYQRMNACIAWIGLGLCRLCPRGVADSQYTSLCDM